MEEWNGYRRSSLAGLYFSYLSTVRETGAEKDSQIVPLHFPAPVIEGQDDGDSQINHRDQ